MVKKFTRRYAGLLLCFMALISGCKKQEIQGPKGDPGTPGGGGNSNISSTTFYSVSNGAWKWDSISHSLKITLDAPAITKDVIDKGAVKVYVQKQAATWSELPYVNGDLFTQFGFDQGHLYLYYINIEGGSAPPPPSEDYRMVILSETP